LNELLLLAARNNEGVFVAAVFVFGVLRATGDGDAVLVAAQSWLRCHFARQGPGGMYFRRHTLNRVGILGDRRWRHCIRRDTVLAHALHEGQL